LSILLGFSKYFMQFLEISWDLGILRFSKILGFFQRIFFIFDEVYEDFQSNLPLGQHSKTFRSFGVFLFTLAIFAAIFFFWCMWTSK
jgi:hypothetical protein